MTMVSNHHVFYFHFFFISEIPEHVSIFLQCYSRNRNLWRQCTNRGLRQNCALCRLEFCTPPVPRPRLFGLLGLSRCPHLCPPNSARGQLSCGDQYLHKDTRSKNQKCSPHVGLQIKNLKFQQNLVDFV